MLDKVIFKKASNAKYDKYLNIFYSNIIGYAKEYNFSEVELLAFLSHVGVETNGFIYTEELSDGSQYENRNDLGNINVGDGAKYKGRGLLQITGRSNYAKYSKLLGKDFINNPELLAPTNNENKNATSPNEKHINAIKSSFEYWLNVKTWGKMRHLVSKIDTSKPFYDELISNIPDNVGNSDTLLKSKYGLKIKGKQRLLCDALGIGRDSNLYYFELTTLNINGGYNHFKERYLNFVSSVDVLNENNYSDRVSGIDNGVFNDNQTQNVDSINDDIIESDNQNDDNISKNDATVGFKQYLKPTIDLKPIEIPSGGTSDKTLYSDIGYSPFIWFNDIQLNEINYMSLTCENFLPEIQIKFIDNYNLFSSKNFPLDNTTIKVLINSSTQYLKSIFMEFKVLSFSKDDIMCTVNGICNIDYLLIPRFEAFNNKTSWEALLDIAKKSNIGFRSNTDSTNDRMTWINYGKLNNTFCKEDIIPYSYKSDESFMWGYVDYFYNLNYVDIETQLSIDPMTEFGVLSMPMSDLGGKLSKDNITEVGLISLTNDTSHRDTNHYFDDDSYTVFNESTYISLQNGYLKKISYYDKNTQEVSIYDLDSISSKGDSNISLKGSDGSKLFYDNNIRHEYVGKLDSDNMHKNYLYAYIQNSYNIKELEKIGMIIKLKSSNFNLYKFQKIQVYIITQAPTFNTPLYNKRLSGGWLIVDIEFVYEEGNFYQLIKLVRRDLGLMDDEQIENSSPSKSTDSENTDIDDVSDDSSEIVENVITFNDKYLFYIEISFTLSNSDQTKLVSMVDDKLAYFNTLSGIEFIENTEENYYSNNNLELVDVRLLYGCLDENEYNQLRINPSYKITKINI